MPQAARVTDPTSHAAPLGAGPGSPDVQIGYLKPWRALPAGAMADAVEAASDAVGKVLSAASLNPSSAASKVVDIVNGLLKMGSQAVADAASGAPVIETCTFAPPIVPVCPQPGGLGVSEAAGSATTTLMTTNATLTTAWATASAAPGGQPAADIAYTMGIQTAVAAAASHTFSSLGGMADLHNCPVPAGVAGPHGPGVVTRGCSTVLINGLPAARQDDKVVEACGGSDPIAVGLGTVKIGE